MQSFAERVKKGKLDPLSKMGKSKLTGREISNYYKSNPSAKKAAKDKTVKSAIELALDLGGALNYAIKQIEKLKKGMSKNPEVKKALRFANEEVEVRVESNFKGLSNKDANNHMKFHKVGKPVVAYIKNTDDGAMGDILFYTDGNNVIIASGNRQDGSGRDMGTQDKIIAFEPLKGNLKSFASSWVKKNGKNYDIKLDKISDKARVFSNSDADNFFTPRGFPTTKVRIKEEVEVQEMDHSNEGKKLEALCAAMKLNPKQTSILATYMKTGKINAQYTGKMAGDTKETRKYSGLKNFKEMRKIWNENK